MTIGNVAWIYNYDIKSRSDFSFLAIFLLFIASSKEKILITYDTVYTGKEDMKFFKLREGSTRGHEWKLEKREHSSGLERGGWFSIRVINPWNELPQKVVNAPSIGAFKRELDNYLKNKSHNM